MLVGPIVHDKLEIFGDPRLNRSEKIKFHPKPSEAALSTAKLNFDNSQPEVASDVISAAAVELGQTVLAIYDCLTL